MILCYLYVENPWAVVGVIVVSGLTDMADGYIARRYNMISEFGKFIDPVADKLTQVSMAACLIVRYPLMWLLFLLMVLRESCLFIWGYLALRKNSYMSGAKWYGKLSTALVYGVMFFLFLLPEMQTGANIMIIVCSVAVTVAMVLYGKYYFDVFRQQRKMAEGSKNA
jgi:cardiolipin synthase